MTQFRLSLLLFGAFVLFAALLFMNPRGPRLGTAQDAKAEPRPAEYTTHVRPLLQKHCLSCHSAKAKKGSLDLERFATLDDIRKDVKVWQAVIEQVEAGEMPPKGKPQLTDAEKKHLLAWTRGFLDAEARARTGDPGHVPLRRLSNAEYNYTIRDLTGVDLQPAREFPADGAAGEGFTNAAEALTDISPALLTKYLNASKDLAEHLVLLPDGFRFSAAKTRRDWTNEGTAALRQFYAALVPADGTLPVQPYLLATVRHRDALSAGQFEAVAAQEKISAKYLHALWAALNDKAPSAPLDEVRAAWRGATEKDVPALAALVTRWQHALWRTVRIGSYIQAAWGAPDGGSYVESLARQVPVDPPALASVPLRVTVKPAPGQAEVVIRLTTQELGAGGAVAWHQPRFEARGKPALLLRDYSKFGPAFELDYPSAFATSAKYLAACAELAQSPKSSLEELAKRDKLDPAFLKQWASVLQLPTSGPATHPPRAALPLTLLDDKSGPDPQRPAISGWKKNGIDLPIVLANSSDQEELIPGRVSARTLGVHPTPQEFVAVAWKSPITGAVTATVRVAHAHPACGNGVAWWLDHNRGDRATRLGEGNIDLGKEAKPPAQSLKVEKGDVLVLAVDPRNNEHTCDMTEVWFTVTETEKPNRVWDLAADVAPNIQAANPHTDKHGHTGIWSFVRGPARNGAAPAPVVPAGSVLGRWKAIATSPERKTDAAKLAKEVASLLSGPRPTDAKSPDRALYDRLVGVESPLFTGVDATKLANPRTKGATFGLPAARFTDQRIVAKAGEVIEVRVPTALMAGHEFVVDAKLEGAGDRLVRVTAGTAGPTGGTHEGSALLGSSASAAYKQLVLGNAEFRKVFPLYLCFPQVVPTDEVVSLKMFHREDEPLRRLFLSDAQARTLDRLWTEQRFVSRQPVAEYEYLPQFMGYTTQDTPKTFQQFFIDRKPRFKRDAEAFEAEERAAIPKQLDALAAFASRAYRRPLRDQEKAELLALYKAIREKGAAHDEAFRGVLSRVLVAPAFLFRIEGAPKGKEPAPVSDWELATRLSYFLWASLPDEELRRVAASGKLRDPRVLEQHLARMLKDVRTRALAVEFGTQWLHVRGFAAHNEKNEQLFPTFTPELRRAMDEEGVLFFLDLFQNDRAVTSLLNADYTYLNETLARHYGIPGVRGPEWRRVDGVRKYGRGGVLGLGSVQTKESGASRTSPVLRGNWVVETLLGEKLPRPPANVPQLPEVEGANKLTVRQLVEQHVKAPECATCHVRIDPFGFAFERYDPIGRLREKDLGGHPVDTRAKLKDGTEFDGLDGLRDYLLAKKKDVVVRLFCKRLLGYALGRSVTLSDTALLDEMVAALAKHDGRVTAAVEVIVRSPQFRMVRGRAFDE